MSSATIPASTPASKAKRSIDLPPTPDSPWDDDMDEEPRPMLDTTRRILQDLERVIETDEWKANAMKDNVFANCRMRKASSSGGSKLISCKTRGTAQSSPTPVHRFRAMALQPGKRMRLG